MQLTHEDSGADRSGNCHPGLVVDTELVHSKYLDFYLQSHAGILGSECHCEFYFCSSDAAAQQLVALAIM